MAIDGCRLPTAQPMAEQLADHQHARALRGIMGLDGPGPQGLFLADAAFMFHCRRSLGARLHYIS